MTEASASSCQKLSAPSVESQPVRLITSKDHLPVETILYKAHWMRMTFVAMTPQFHIHIIHSTMSRCLCSMVRKVKTLKVSRPSTSSSVGHRLLVDIFFFVEIDSCQALAETTPAVEITGDYIMSGDIANCASCRCGLLPQQSLCLVTNNRSVSRA
ncbi:hypothetical protein CEXT_104341 [Caerostris extrusa]|uniref:Uncharacterized protein n=1 Tax=Caerostris extrusa TaxID=172846 RepID=A0AAV4N3N2_CAEEX|nr:hypothetical protein CEXT_104341 [Caerostris extrusa]